MSSARQITQYSFSTGEISPLLYGRQDVAKIAAGLRRDVNMRCSRVGPLIRRAGSVYLANSHLDGGARLMRFRFNAEQAYVLEWSASALRWFTDRGSLAVAATTAALTNGEFAGLTGWTTVSGSPSASGGVCSLPSGAAIRQQLDTAAPAQIHALKLTVTGGSVTVTLGSAAGASDILSVTLAAGYHLIGASVPAGALWLQIANAASSPSVSAITLFSDEAVRIDTPYGLAAAKAMQRAQSADVLYLASQDVKPYKLQRLAAYRWSLVAIAFTSDPFTTDGNPGSVSFHSDRLWWAGSKSKPQTLWASKKGAYEDHGVSSPLKSDDAIKITLLANEVAPITWILSAARQLYVGTGTGEYRVYAPIEADGLAPDNVDATAETTRGCARIQPVQLDGTVLFVQGGRRIIRELAYAFSDDAWRAPDLTLLAPHLLRESPALALDYAAADSLLFVVREDGLLLVLTYDREQEVTGWVRYQLGGATADTAYGVVEDVAIIPAPDTAGDDVYLLVRRVIDGATVRFIEYLAAEHAPTDAQDRSGAIYVDASLSYSGSPASVLTGLDHLEAQTVEILADGAPQALQIVAAGQITLNRPAATITVGLPCPGELVFQPFAAETREMSEHGARSRIRQARFDLLNTAAEITLRGAGGIADDLLVLRSIDDPLDQPPPLFTGWRDVAVPADWSRDASLTIAITGPGNCVLRTLVIERETRD